MNKIIVVLCLVAVTGCNAIPLNPNAQLVKISNAEPGKKCKFLGDVTSNQGNFLTGSWTSNSDLETGARNDLKNKANTLGGNYVAILTQRAGQTGGGGEFASFQQTNVTLTGNVYRCPS